jgi:hypothetical protein
MTVDKARGKNAINLMYFIASQRKRNNLLNLTFFICNEYTIIRKEIESVKKLVAFEFL